MATTALPTEILIEIFGYFDYCTIHSSIKPVCRTFENAASASTFKLLGGLDTKIWAMIFSNLHYFDLKQEVRLVCKAFSRIVMRHDNLGLAAKMFREKPKNTTPITAKTEVLPHPVFTHGFWWHNSETDIKNVHIHCFGAVIGDTELITTDVADQNATSPPATEITLKFGALPLPRIISTRHMQPLRAITVLDVMETSCNIMATKVSEEEKQIIIHKYPRWRDEIMGDINYRFLQGNYCSFEQFDKVEGRDDGTIYLEAINLEDNNGY